MVPAFKNLTIKIDESEVKDMSLKIVLANKRNSWIQLLIVNLEGKSLRMYTARMTVRLGTVWPWPLWLWISQISKASCICVVSTISDSGHSPGNVCSSGPEFWPGSPSGLFVSNRSIKCSQIHIFYCKFPAVKGDRVLLTLQLRESIGENRYCPRIWRGKLLYFYFLFPAGWY